MTGSVFQNTEIETSGGMRQANRVVVGIGPFRNPVLPPIAPADTNIRPIRSGVHGSRPVDFGETGRGRLSHDHQGHRTLLP